MSAATLLGRVVTLIELGYQASFDVHEGIDGRPVYLTWFRSSTYVLASYEGYSIKDMINICEMIIDNHDQDYIDKVERAGIDARNTLDAVEREVSA